MLEENKKLVRRYYELVAGDLTGIEDLVTANFVDHHFPPDMPPGPAGVRQFFTKFIPTFFSDLRIEIDFLLAEGDRVDCHFVALFKHTGEIGRRRRQRESTPDSGNQHVPDRRQSTGRGLGDLRQRRYAPSDAGLVCWGEVRRTHVQIPDPAE